MAYQDEGLIRNGCRPDTHRLEFVEYREATMFYRCKDCGESIQEFQDCLGG